MPTVSLRAFIIVLFLILTLCIGGVILGVSVAFNTEAIDEILIAHVRALAMNTGDNIQNWLSEAVTQLTQFQRTVLQEDLPLPYTIFNNLTGEAQMTYLDYYHRHLFAMMSTAGFLRETGMVIAFADHSMVYTEVPSAAPYNSSQVIKVTYVGHSTEPLGVYNNSNDLRIRDFNNLTAQHQIGPFVRRDFGKPFIDPHVIPWFKLPPRVPLGIAWDPVIQVAGTRDGQGSNAVAFSLFNNKNEFLGVMATEINVGGAARFLRETERTENTHSFLLNNNNEIFATTHPHQLGFIMNSTLPDPPDTKCIDSFLGSARTPDRLQKYCRYHLSTFPYPPLQAAVNTSDTAHMLDFSSVHEKDEQVDKSSYVKEASIVVDGEKYFVAVKRMVVTNATGWETPGMEWKVVYILPASDVTGPVVRGRNISIYSSIGIFVFFNICAFVVLTVILAPLERVQERMMAAANLLDDDDEDSRSVFTEIQNLQVAYIMLKTQLNRLRQFVPQSLFWHRERNTTAMSNSAVASSTGAHSADTNPSQVEGSGFAEMYFDMDTRPPAVAKNSQSQDGLGVGAVTPSTIHLNTSSHHPAAGNRRHTVDVADPQQQQEEKVPASTNPFASPNSVTSPSSAILTPRGNSSSSNSPSNISMIEGTAGGLNLKTLIAEKNAVVPRTASVLSLHLVVADPNDYAKLKIVLDGALEAFVEHVSRSDGVVDSLSFPTCKASFNAHVPCYQHPRKAASVATRIENALMILMESCGIRFTFSIIVDSATLGVGSIGSDRHRAAVVIGNEVTSTDALHALTEAHYQGVRVVFTDRIRIALKDAHRLVPVDIVQNDSQLWSSPQPPQFHGGVVGVDDNERSTGSSNTTLLLSGSSSSHALSPRIASGHQQQTMLPQHRQQQRLRRQRQTIALFTLLPLLPDGSPQNPQQIHESVKVLRNATAAAQRDAAVAVKLLEAFIAEKSETETQPAQPHYGRLLSNFRHAVKTHAEELHVIEQHDQDDEAGHASSSPNNTSKKRDDTLLLATYRRDKRLGWATMGDETIDPLVQQHHLQNVHENVIDVMAGSHHLPGASSSSALFLLQQQSKTSGGVLGASETKMLSTTTASGLLENDDDCDTVEKVRDEVEKVLEKKNAEVKTDETSLVPFMFAANEDSTLNGGGGSGARPPPEELTDMAGTVWIREDTLLGAGAMGQVFRGWSATGQPCAMKILPLSMLSSVEALLSEMEIAREFKHPNIVCHYSTAVLKHHFIMLSEYVPGGTLQMVMNKFGASPSSDDAPRERRMPSMMVRAILRDILHGLEYLHSRGYTHADMKPENVLITHEGTCKLADFGCSINAPKQCEDYSELRGTPKYMAPEVAKGDSPSPSSDIWAVGIIAVTLLTGKQPWETLLPANNSGERAVAQFLGKLARSTKESPVLPDIDHQLLQTPHGGGGGGCEAAAVELLDACIKYDPKERASAVELLTLPYFTTS